MPSPPWSDPGSGWSSASDTWLRRKTASGPTRRGRCGRVGNGACGGYTDVTFPVPRRSAGPTPEALLAEGPRRMLSTNNPSSPTAKLATPTVIQCNRCRSARSQVVMARVRHVAGRESEWSCPECAAVWAFVSEPKTAFVGGHIRARRPSVCPCPLGGPLEVARDVATRSSARSWLWVCAGCGVGHPVSRVAYE